MHKYNITWRMGQFTKEEIEEGDGACDAFVFLSMLYPEDGSFSMLPIAVDQSGGQMNPNEIFKVWVMLALRLSESEELSTNRKLFAKEVWESYRKIILMMQKEDEGDDGKKIISVCGYPSSEEKG